MAKILSNNGIITGLPVEAHHVSQSVNALTAAEAYDISISGSLTVNAVKYPITDGTNGQVITTDGVGNATFQTITTVPTASFVTSSNVYGPYGADSVLSSSWANTSSYSLFASEASSSILAIRAITADNVTSASYAATASYIEDSVFTSRYDFTGVDNFTIPHRLGTDNVLVQIWEENGTNYDLVIPDNIQVISQNDVSVRLAVPTTGYAVVTRGGFITPGTSDTASVALSLSHSISGGYGIVPFTFDGTSDKIVAIDPATILSTASFAITASYAANAGGVGQAVITSSISNFTQSFERGDGSTYENYLPSQSSAPTVTPTKRFTFAGSVINAPHNLNSENIFVQVYESTTPYATQLIPDKVEIIDNNNVRITLAASTTGFAIVGQSGFLKGGTIISAISSSYAVTSSHALTASYIEGNIASSSYSNTASFTLTASYVDNTYKQSVTGGVTYAITHNLSEEFPIVQAYEITTRAQEIPASVVSAGPQSVVVTFATTFDGTIIVKK